MLHRTIAKILCVAFLLAIAAGADRTSFAMAVADSFSIAGRGVIAIGTVERGSVKVNDSVDLIGLLPTKRVTVSALQVNGKEVQEAKVGQEVGLLLRGAGADDVKRGQVVAEPDSIKAWERASAKISLLATAQGGRKTPIAKSFRPLCRFRGVDFTVTFQLPAGQDSVQPGQSDILVGLQLMEPLALEKGQTFDIREAGKTVGHGVIISVGD